MQASLKQFLKKVPFVRSLYHWGKAAYLRTQTVEKRFEYLYKNRSWGGVTSVSGSGSDPDQTEILVQELPHLLTRFGISSLLDIPCGDFNWMKRIHLEAYRYTGADIVAEIIAHNTQRYAQPHLTFRHMNLLTDDLPQSDLVLVRDCLVHFSFEDVFRALRTICRSGSTYLLATTFTLRPENEDVMTGGWRTLNLQRSPFYFPEPLYLLNEGCTQGNGQFTDKSLGLWRIADLEQVLRAGQRH